MVEVRKRKMDRTVKHQDGAWDVLLDSNLPGTTYCIPQSLETEICSFSTNFPLVEAHTPFSGHQLKEPNSQV